MKKYRIAIEETLRKVVEIEAETPGLAVCRAEDEYNEEKHVLSADNFAGADIALSTDDSTVMETLEDVDFIGYVQRRFEECRESISVEDKVRLAFGSFDNALYEFGEYRKEAARNRPQVYLVGPSVPERCLAQPFFHGAHSPVLLPRKHDGVPAA